MLPIQGRVRPSHKGESVSVSCYTDDKFGSIFSSGFGVFISGLVDSEKEAAAEEAEAPPWA